ncbi:hypothetical protein AB0O91_25490 [Kitasatospora sp. NPDC089797]|uniref:hypothetical protein n=1 Tax=Kitasatospora sp. NPDC089797 TaxID=3155298 RepID=UPI00342DFC13
MIVSKRNSLRLAAVATLGVLFLGAAGPALAAADPAPVAAASAAASVAASITAKPSAASVQAWQLFRVTGTTTGLKAGSTVTLEQKQHGSWVALPASVQTNRNGSYSLGVKLGLKGVNELRVVSGSTASPVFTVTVR